MALSNITFRIDEGLKHELEETCKELGMNMTTAFTIYAKKITREKRIPFDVSIDPFFSASNQAALKESMEQLEAGKVVVKSIEELEAMAEK